MHMFETREEAVKYLMSIAAEDEFDVLGAFSPEGYDYRIEAHLTPKGELVFVCRHEQEGII